MNVLLLGNGFDIYYNLPTKYSNFLHTVEFLIKHNSDNIKTIGDVFSSPMLQDCDSFIYECYKKHKDNYNKIELDKEKIIKELSEKLNSLTNALKIYLDCFIENTIASISSEDDFEPYKAFDYINRTITFNYTKTFEKLYSNNECFHIHGDINNNIVLGINPDKYDELETVDTSFISFKKYFQRSKYETDLEYLKWTRELGKDVDYYALIVMGHSLDKTDKDIILEMFSHANPIYIFYHNQEAKESYISNLINIFGLEKYGYLRKEGS